MAPGFRLPLDTRPMEAKSAGALPDEGGPWQYEPKWDGFRCLAFRAGPAVDLRAKSGKPLGRYFPELVAAFGAVAAHDFVVDGEIVIETGGGPSFDALQMRLHPAASRIRKLAAETPAKIILFDMLVDTDGAVIVDRPLSARRAALETFVATSARTDITLSERSEALAAATGWLGDAGHGRIDGVVAKRLDDPYRAGERAMIKVKRRRTADCVVAGFRYLAGSRRVGSLLLGLYDEAGKLDHVGFTSTIAEDERGSLTKRLEALSGGPGFTGKAPGGPSRWSNGRSGDWQPLRPELVAEVRFDHVTGDRFRHGTTFVRWRPDKAPQQCTFDQIA